MEPRPTILVVDDEPRNRSLMRGVLAAFYDVVEAPSGIAALDLLKRIPADLVLLDVMMPEQDGFETCRLIKAEARSPFLPVLLVTALSQQEDRNRGLESGADDFLQKPIDRQELLLRVRGFLRLRDQDRLIRAQVEEVKRLQSLKDDMVSLLVHDLRNPLAGILSAVELAADSSQDPQQREDLARAVRSCESLRLVLDEALQVRLMEERTLVAHRAPADFAALIASACATVDPVARRRKIVVRTTVEGDARALVDEKLVRRSLENLLSNAVKYTPSGGEIWVRASNQGGLVEIEVADSGAGIPDSLKGVLFERFGSLEAHRGQQRRGIGLGLYLVKLVAEAHGGGVSVHDSQRGGALFRMLLSPPPPRALAGAA